MLYVLFKKQIRSDQPERIYINYIMVGTSNFSSRFEYSLHLKTCVHHLPQCESYFEQMRKHSLFLDNIVFCKNCVDWNMIRKSPLMLIDPPENYPISILLDDKKLKSKKIIFENLNKRNNVCYETFING